MCDCCNSLARPSRITSRTPDVAPKRIKSSQESDRSERLRRNLPDVPPDFAKASDETFTISTLQKMSIGVEK
jgi:hypothetical protein